jgi:carboxypeptidase C (cathepsin A)
LPNAGESYGGRFIPNIANHILTTQADINLKGLVIGNGVCDCSGAYCYGEDHSFQLYNSDNQFFAAQTLSVGQVLCGPVNP